MNADRGGGSIGFVARNTVDMDHPFFAVDLGDLTLTALVLPTYNSNFIVFTDRDGTGLHEH
jgi:hypothetical protein